MIKSLKISTALLICTVFIFRILFVSIGIISSSNSRQNNNCIKTYFSTTLKKRRNFSSADNSVNSGGFTAIEISEEDADDDDDQFKSNPFLVQVLYSLVASKAENTLKKISSFFKDLTYSSSERYLLFQVFRV